MGVYKLFLKLLGKCLNKCFLKLLIRKFGISKKLLARVTLYESEPNPEQSLFGF